MTASLRRRRRLLSVLVISAVVGVLAAKANDGGGLHVAAATTHAMVDFGERSLISRRALAQDVSTLQKRTELFGLLIVSEPVLTDIARRLEVPADQLSGVTRTSANVPIPLREPGSEERASQIAKSRAPYRLETQAAGTLPILAIYAQAPSPEQATQLADAAIPALSGYLQRLARSQRFPDHKLVRVRQLEPAAGAFIARRGRAVIGALTFMVAFALSCAVLLSILALRASRDDTLTRARVADDATDNWPHTRRLLPWMLAGFIAMLWLVPFQKIELAVSLPVDAKLDRLVLPLILALWVFGLLANRRAAPRLRVTTIHLALAAFVACAFLSVVLNAHDLTQTLEVELAIKKLPLLCSYACFFVIVASSVRPTEVRAFLSLTLALAVVCSAGIVYENRFGQNLFSVWSERLLPGMFTFSGDLAGQIELDSLGRRGIVGPAEVSLEAVTMIAMALPILIVGLLAARAPRRRVLYVLGACLLTAAMLSTARKSALLAPASVVLALAYFRRRELLSLAPLGLVVAVAVSFLSPGAAHGIVNQFLRHDSASVATTSDRVADYDAVRPDLWTAPLFGRGYGSYNHETYRILDSEILSRVLEVGVLGLVAFLMLGLSVVLAARATIAGRDPTYAPLALVGAAAAVCFVVVATLYDVTGFPHATYTFLYLAGLTAIVVGRRSGPVEAAGDAARSSDSGNRISPATTLALAGRRLHEPDPRRDRRSLERRADQPDPAEADAALAGDGDGVDARGDRHADLAPR